MNTETMERMRPAAVERHVRSVLRRSLCDDFTIQRGTQAAVRALNAGNTAHRAIRAGIEVGMQQRMLARALGPAPLTPRDHFMRDVLLDCLGLLGLIVISALLVLSMWAFMGKPV